MTEGVGLVTGFDLPPDRVPAKPALTAPSCRTPSRPRRPKGTPPVDDGAGALTTAYGEYASQPTWSHRGGTLIRDPESVSLRWNAVAANLEWPARTKARATPPQQYEGFAATPDFVIDVGEDSYGFLNPDKFKAGFAHDASDADAAFMRDSQVPINMSVFGTPVAEAAWQTKPSWAVIATEDRAFDLAMLRHMANRIGATITEVAASHAVFMTQPDVVADTIDQAGHGATVAANLAEPAAAATA